MYIFLKWTNLQNEWCFSFLCFHSKVMERACNRVLRQRVTATLQDLSTSSTSVVLGLGKIGRGEITESKTCGGVLQMRWLLGRLGNQRPHGRRVITPAHEGVVSTVWQSRHNSGLIHHMGIMPLTGTAPKKSYTRSSPASDSLNNPIPLLSTHCVWLERERANEQELLSERKKKKNNNIYLGPCSTAKADHLCSVKKKVVEAVDIHAFSFPLQITKA